MHNLQFHHFPVFCLLVLTSSAILSSSQASSSHHDWDIIIFTQHWPLTVCMQWKEKGEQHKCALPTIRNIWTVHGIWPTKLGTIGPQFCNNSLHFNPDLLQPIEKQLEQYWLNVYNGTKVYSLWKHEWQKHGTCAAVLPALNTENKYFGQGLSWINTYNMKNILSRAGINPDATGYTPQQVWDAVKGVLGKNPAVECFKDTKTEKSFLFEIRICFDKNLELTDCDGIKGTHTNSSNGIHTNCALDRLVIYPSNIPDEIRMPIPPRPQPCRAPWLFTGLRLIQWLQWMTL